MYYVILLLNLLEAMRVGMQLFSGVPKNWPHFAIFEGFVIIIAKMIDFMLPIQKHDSKLVWKIYLNQMTPEIIEIIFELIESI